MLWRIWRRWTGVKDRISVIFHFIWIPGYIKGWFLLWVTEMRWVLIERNFMNMDELSSLCKIHPRVQIMNINNNMDRSMKQICYMDSVAVNRNYINSCGSAGLRAPKVGRSCPAPSPNSARREATPSPGKEEGSRQPSVLFYLKYFLEPIDKGIQHFPLTSPMFSE